MSRGQHPDQESEVLLINVRQVVTEVWVRKDAHAQGLYAVVLAPELAKRSIGFRAAVARDIAVHYLGVGRPADFAVHVLDISHRLIDPDPEYRSPWGYDKGSIEKISDEVISIVADGRTAISSHAELDSELKALATQVLTNAFYRDYSQLVARYLTAGAGLDCADLESRLAEVSNPFGRDDVAAADAVSIEVVSSTHRIGYHTIREALQQQGDRVEVAGQTAFEWRESVGWYFVDSNLRASANEAESPGPL